MFRNFYARSLWATVGMEVENEKVMHERLITVGACEVCLPRQIKSSRAHLGGKRASDMCQLIVSVAVKLCIANNNFKCKLSFSVFNSN